MTSDIEWLLGPDGTQGFTWNPITGCSPASAGCLNCYAAAIAGRGMCNDHKGLTRSARRRNASGKLVKLSVFNGTLHLHHGRLDEPIRKRKGKRVFVNSMSDLFHPDAPFEFIRSVYASMAATPQHTFLVLTKRPEVAAAFFAWLGDDPVKSGISTTCWTWPLPHVQVGFSAEDQPNWDRRYPHLDRIRAAVKWVSVEPQIGPVELDLRGVDWIVVGGESGPGARPFHIEWATSIVEQCDAASVPVFVKQLGGRPRHGERPVVLGDKKGVDPNEWVGSLAHLRRREALDGSGKRYTPLAV